MSNLGMRRWVTAIAVVAITLVGAGCRSTGGASSAPAVADDVSRAIAGKADELFNSYKTAKVGASDESFIRSANELIAQADSVKLSPEALAKVQQIRAIYNVYEVTNQRWAQIKLEIPPLIEANVQPTRRLSQQELNDMIAHAQNIIPDVACDFAWTALKPSDKGFVAEYEKEGAKMYEGAITGVSNMTLLGASKFVGGAAQKLFAAAHNANGVNWLMYGKGLYEKGRDLTQDGDKLILTESGFVSQAYIYFVRHCMLAPGAK